MNHWSLVDYLTYITEQGNYFELNELPKLLLPGEKIEGVISGFYSAGPATICVTNERLLLVDKKFIRLTIEDIRFDSLGEIQYSQQLFLASLKLIFAGQTLQFRSFYRRELRILFNTFNLRRSKKIPKNLIPSTL